MKNKNVCQKNKFGYCWWGLKCRDMHISMNCVEKSCNVDNCEKRHPKDCFYFKKFAMCKFNDTCSYKHQKIQHEHINLENYEK